MAERGTTATVAPATTTAVSYYQEPSRNPGSGNPGSRSCAYHQHLCNQADADDDDIQDTEEYVEETLSLDEVEKE